MRALYLVWLNEHNELEFIRLATWIPSYEHIFGPGHEDNYLVMIDAEDEYVDRFTFNRRLFWSSDPEDLDRALRTSLSIFSGGT